MRVRVPKEALWKAIRKRCLSCCGGSPKAVRECEKVDCELWIFRMGPRALARVIEQSKKDGTFVIFAHHFAPKRKPKGQVWAEQNKSPRRAKIDSEKGEDHVPME